MEIFTKCGADPDLDLTILLSQGANTAALVSIVIKVAFLHIPSSVVYGSLILLAASSSKTEGLVVVLSFPTASADELGSFKVGCLHCYWYWQLQ